MPSSLTRTPLRHAPCLPGALADALPPLVAAREQVRRVHARQPATVELMPAGDPDVGDLAGACSVYDLGRRIVHGLAVAAAEIDAGEVRCLAALDGAIVKRLVDIIYLSIIAFSYVILLQSFSF